MSTSPIPQSADFPGVRVLFHLRQLTPTDVHLLMLHEQITCKSEATAALLCRERAKHTKWRLPCFHMHGHIGRGTADRDLVGDKEEGSEEMDSTCVCKTLKSLFYFSGIVLVWVAPAEQQNQWNE